jgi:hypothetical protein
MTATGSKQSEAATLRTGLGPYMRVRIDGAPPFSPPVFAAFGESIEIRACACHWRSRMDPENVSTALIARFRRNLSQCDFARSIRKADGIGGICPAKAAFPHQRVYAKVTGLRRRGKLRASDIRSSGQRPSKKKRGLPLHQWRTFRAQSTKFQCPSKTPCLSSAMRR